MYVMFYAVNRSESQGVGRGVLGLATTYLKNICAWMLFGTFEDFVFRTDLIFNLSLLAQKLLTERLFAVVWIVYI